MTTKIQYNNFETGEFTEEKERTLDETIHLINNFPWQQQRDHITIGLTDPSITIEGANGDFLKLAPFYHGKFVLYLCKIPETLFSRSFDNVSNTFPLIQSFFDDPAVFDTTSFKKQTTWFQHPSIHFRTNNFIYDLNTARRFVAATPLLIVLAYTLVFTCIGIFGNPHARPLVVFSLLLFVVLFAIARLFLNHLKVSEGNVLILSKGKDVFAYGPAANLVWRNKKDIAELITHGRRGRGGTYYAMTRVEVIFSNGEDPLDISCLLINWNDLMNKFPGCPTSTVSELFPFIPRDVSAPS